MQVRVAPSLEALLAAALERDALQSEVVETAALRRSDVIKTALLRSVSHDLRSPLTAILTSAEALRSPSLTDAERGELAEAVGVEASRLSRLIDDLLDLSRLEADAAEPQPRVVLGRGGRARRDRGPAAAAPAPSRSRSTPTCRPCAPTPPSSSAPSPTCSRTPTGIPTAIRCPCARATSAGASCCASSTAGPGIPQAQRERIFEPFYRSGTAATGHRGSGLGLAIVRGFVEANGGKVWVESLPNQATSFVVELPLTPRAGRGPPGRSA